jgi:hypothetical protein
MGDQTSLIIKELADFGGTTSGLGAGKGSKSTMSDLTSGLSGPTGDVGSASFTGMGLCTNESQNFNARYNDEVIDAMMSCCKELSQKLQMIGGGAIVMAANYINGDAAQAGAMSRAHGSSDVFDMFSADPSKGLDYDIAHPPKGAKPDPGVKVKLDAPTDPNPKPPSNLCVAETPQQMAARQAKQHRDTYHKDEHWVPVKPPEPSDTVILAPGPPGEHPKSTGTVA